MDGKETNQQNTLKVGDRFEVLCGNDEDREISKQDIVRRLAKTYSKAERTMLLLAIACIAILIAIISFEVFFIFILNLTVDPLLVIEIIITVVIFALITVLLVKSLKNYFSKEKARKEIFDRISNENLDVKIYTCTYKWTEIKKVVSVRPGRTIPVREVEYPVYHISFNKKIQFVVSASVHRTVNEGDKVALVTLGDGIVHCAYLMKTCKFEFPVKTEKYEDEN